MEWQWYQLDHMQSFAPHAREITMPTPHHSVFFTGRMPFLPPNQQRQSTEKPALKYGENMLFHTCIELQCSQTATEINTITCTVLVKSDPTV